MVVPRSSSQLAADDEFTLFAVTVFKKHSAEFVHKCRERRWVPREWKFTEGGKEAEDKELEKLEKEERKVWGEALRLSRTGYSDAVMCWVHVLALRVFVETVLRYGLPLSFVCGLVRVCFVFPSSSFFPLTPFSSLIANKHPKDRPQKIQKGKTKPRRRIRPLRRQRLFQGQKGSCAKG